MQWVVPGWQRSFLADHEGGLPVSGRGLDSAVFWLYKGEGTCKTRAESYNTPFKNNISKTQNTGHVLFSSHFILASHRGLNKSFKRQNKKNVWCGKVLRSSQCRSFLSNVKCRQSAFWLVVVWLKQFCLFLFFSFLSHSLTLDIIVGTFFYGPNPNKTNPRKSLVFTASQYPVSYVIFLAFSQV